MSDKEISRVAKATIGGGCFWCLEAVFAQQPGVEKVVSGYAGGHDPQPTYTEVCNGTTGHAEVVQISYDPDVFSFEMLLDLFWRAHDPTTMNRQGNDVGTQYRSIILYHNEQQKEYAQRSLAVAQEQFEDKIVTEIIELGRFFPAEEYHQEYYANNPGQGYCSFVIRPKLQKLGLKA